MRLTLKLLFALLLLIIAMFIMIIIRSIMDRQDDYDVSLADTEVPLYIESTIPFNQANDFSDSLPFLGSAIIDIENDGVEELFLGGSKKSNDGLFKFTKNQLVAIKGSAGISNNGQASFGSVVLDVDGNGYQDLIVAREDGIWLHLNEHGMFNNQKLAAQMPAGTTPLSIAIADLNRDGAFDMYVAGYIQHELVEGQNIFREGYGGSIDYLSIMATTALLITLSKQDLNINITLFNQLLSISIVMVKKI